jgi:hypothetical protein
MRAGRPARPRGPLASSGKARAAWHLARRFVETLGRSEPRPDEESFARGVLLPGEGEAWRRMSPADRRHAIAVAKRVRASADPAGRRREVLAAALLHDAGKAEAGAGVGSRVTATLAAVALGRPRVASWASRPGWTGRLGRYVSHDRIGAVLLAEAGSDPLVVSWAAQHHLDSACWDVPAEIGALLKAADDG